MQETMTPVLWLLILLLGTEARIEASLTTTQASAEQWVAEYIQPVRDLLLFQDSPSRPMSDDMKWIATGRIWGGYNNDREFSFVLKQTFTGRTEVTIRAPLNESIHYQLRRIAIESENRTLSVSEVAKKIKIHECMTNEEKLPDIRMLTANLQDLHLSAIPPGEISLDATIFELSLRSQGGNFVNVRYELSSETGKSQPVISWMFKVRESLNRCAEAHLNRFQNPHGIRVRQLRRSELACHSIRKYSGLGITGQ